jgi:hypothetical protein
MARFVAALLLLSTPAAAQVADFDTHTEGSPSVTVVDGGITFTNMYNGLGGTPNFVFEQADGTLSGMPGFTTPMTLSFGGYVVGPMTGFSRIISFDIATGGLASSGSVEVFEYFSYPANSITLQALLGTTVVASQTVPIAGGISVNHYSLSVSAPAFDRMHVLGSGPTDSGAFFANVDHVTMGGAPTISRFCFGDGTGGACPCANTGATDRGCQNSAGTGGADLAFSGTTSPDTIVLSASEELPHPLSLFLQGNTLLSPAVAFGDGLRCTGGLLKRLYVHPASGGSVDAPDFGLGDPPITVRSAALGDPIAPGSTRYYQTYYRDPSPTFCPAPTGNTFNATNGLVIVWN